MAINKELRRSFQKFTNEYNIGQFIDEEGERLAENLGINVTQSVRQQRNELEAGMDSRWDETDLIDATDLELTPQQLRNMEASFKAHTKAALRQIADQVGNELQAKEFMGINPDHEPVILKLDEHAAGNEPTLSNHPHSQTLSVPIPPGYEDVAEDAAKLLPYSSADRMKALKAQLAARVNKAKL